MIIKPKVVFMGSPDFAVPCLRALAEIAEIVGVVTQPDKPAGRGLTLTPPPVKAAALALGYPVIQPPSLKEEAVYQQLADWAPDVIVVVAFGQLLRKNVLELPKFGCVNVHASLLPAYRGAAPIQAAILNGETRTGVTIMKMDVGLDTGPILSKAEIEIADDETGGSLFGRLSELGASALVKTLPAYLAGKITPVAQPETGASYFGMIRKEDGDLKPSMGVFEAERKTRAYFPWPGTSLEIGGEKLKIHKARVTPGNPKLGEREVINGYPALGFAGGWLVLLTLQPPSKKAMDGKAYLAGKRDWLE